MERQHQTIEEQIRNSCKGDLSKWYWKIDAIVQAINTAPSERIANLSPFQLMYGRNPHLPDYFTQSQIIPKTDFESISKKHQDTLSKIAELNKLAMEKLQEYRNKMSETYNHRRKLFDFKNGDKVWRKALNSKKLLMKRTGPHLIKGKGKQSNNQDNGNYIIEFEGKEIEVHENELQPFKVENKIEDYIEEFVNGMFKDEETEKELKEKPNIEETKTETEQPGKTRNNQLNLKRKLTETENNELNKLNEPRTKKLRRTELKEQPELEKTKQLETPEQLKKIRQSNKIVSESESEPDSEPEFNLEQSKRAEPSSGIKTTDNSNTKAEDESLDTGSNDNKGNSKATPNKKKKLSSTNFEDRKGKLIPHKPPLNRSLQIGKDVAVWWPGENRYFTGTLGKYSKALDKYLIHYDDETTNYEFPERIKILAFTCQIKSLSKFPIFIPELVPNDSD